MTNMIFAPWLRIGFIRQWFGIQSLLTRAGQNIDRFIRELIEIKVKSSGGGGGERSEKEGKEETSGGHYFMDIVINLLRRGVFSWQNVEIECNTIILAVITNFKK